MTAASPGDSGRGELGPDGEDLLAGLRAFQEEELAARGAALEVEANGVETALDELEDVLGPEGEADE
jgi:hypothetical protein